MYINTIMKHTLIVDTRESSVLQHEYEFSTINHIVKQITTGDYVLLDPNNNIIAVFERKSYADFAASFRDGRHDNRAKLLNLRQTTGCRIIYIIEGSEFPEPMEMYGKIPYKNIESSIFHMIMRDNISIIRTESTIGTAKMLSRFMRSMQTIDMSQKYEHNEGIIDQPKEGSYEIPQEINKSIEMLTEKQTKSIHDSVRIMWGQFRGISVDGSDPYIKQWSLREVFMKQIKHTEIESFKPNKRKISPKAVNSLKYPDAQGVRVLSKVPGISLQTAKMLLIDRTIEELLSTPNIDELIVYKNNKKLGLDKTKKILEHFDYKYC